MSHQQRRLPQDSDEQLQTPELKVPGKQPLTTHTHKELVFACVCTGHIVLGVLSDSALLFRLKWHKSSLVAETAAILTL